MNTMTKCWLAVIVTFLPFMAVAYDSSLGACSSTNHYNYGDTGPDSGFVFYIEEGGCSGYEAQPFDGPKNSYIWSDAIKASAAYNNTPITQALSCPTATDPTTPYCWHLPTPAEAHFIYIQKKSLGASLLMDQPYWTSMSIGPKSAFNIEFSKGTKHFVLQATQYAFRAIRSFTNAP